MSATSVIAPVVNRHGTDRTALIDGYTDAIRSLRFAAMALAAIHPHGRDYPGDASAWLVASKQNHLRRHAVDTVIRELELLVQNVGK